MNRLKNHLLAIAAACLLIQPAAAQMAGAASAGVLPQPKLSFSAFELALAEAVAPDPALAAFYGANMLRPIFTGPDAAPRREALLAAVATAPMHGLPPERYLLEDTGSTEGVLAEIAHARLLSRWASDVSRGLVDPAASDPMNKRERMPLDLAATLHDFVDGDPRAALDRLPPGFPDYARLRAMLAERLQLVAPPGTPAVPDGVYRLGSEGDGVVALRQRLVALGFAAAPGGSPLFDEQLEAAVRDYQDRVDLPVDGIVGPQTVGRLNGGAGSGARPILLAMERLRWLNGHDLSQRHIWVNVPAYNAEIREGGETTFETRVVVGKHDPEQETPEFSDVMEFVVPNPRWNVPPSITARSYLPQLRANRYAVAHLDVVDRRGNIVPRDSIDFSQYSDASFPYFLRQKPSADNALGLVKFMFPNRWNIYLHDTPSKSLFNQAVRAHSNGCVRVARPFELAYELLRGNAADPRAYFHRHLDSGQEKWLKMAEPLPIHIVYFTALPGPDGGLMRWRDVYGRDAKLWAAMQRAGLE